MKFRIKNNLTHNLGHLLRQANYVNIFDKISQKESYVRKLTNQHYPRFHLYIKETPEELIFDLHLDQSAPRYKNQRAHKADYKSEKVKSELIRIYETISPFISSSV